MSDNQPTLDMASTLRRYGLELLKLAADLDAGIVRAPDTKLPAYQPSFKVVDGVEEYTGRLACCGAGPDQRDPRTTERLHLAGCSLVAGAGIAAGRSALHGLSDATVRDLAAMVDEEVAS